MLDPSDGSTASGTRGPTFNVSHDAAPQESLLVGFSSFGLAGLTAVDYLVDQLEMDEVGHISATGLPSITPFVEGRPHHPIRLFSRDDLDVTVLEGELLVPPFAGESLSEAILDWTAEHDVHDIAILTGVPMAHDPEEHRTYYVATDDYHDRRLTETDVQPMGQGFLDGFNATLLEQGMDSSLGVGVYITPIHPQPQDVEAAIRLVETISTVYGLSVDAGPLRTFAEEIQKYFTDLAERLEVRPEELPEDRMYM